MTTKPNAPSVNYHLTKSCNMRCKFCYATFNDIGVVKHDFLKSAEIIKMLAKAKFKKMNFAGGEPTLVKELPELAKLSKELGMVTTIVTNGAKLAQKEVYDSLIPHLDWVAISIDSLSDESNLSSGRAVNGKTALTETYYKELITKLKADGVKVKINTVVSQYNHLEDISAFINEVKPNRWKILQAMPVDGQNSIQQGKFEITNEQFSAYLKRHSTISSEIDFIPESIEYIRGSYVMVSPEGAFFDSTKNKHTYSEPILQVGVEEALKQVNFNYELFLKRGGLYNWENNKINTYKRITLSGEVASGKSTIGKLLAEKLNYSFISLGNKIRATAKSEGLSIVDFQKNCERNPGKDLEIDKSFSEDCNSQEKIIIDYRLGYKFINDSFNIFLKVDEQEAERRMKNTVRFNETHTTVIERNKITKQQFINAYNEDYTNPNNYDIVINTSDFSSQEAIALHIMNVILKGGQNGN